MDPKGEDADADADDADAKLSNWECVKDNAYEQLYECVSVWVCVWVCVWVRVIAISNVRSSVSLSFKCPLNAFADDMKNVAKCDPKRPSSLHLHISWNLNLHTHTHWETHTHAHVCNYVHLVSLFRLFVSSFSVWSLASAFVKRDNRKSDWQQINQDLAQRRTKTKQSDYTDTNIYTHIYTCTPSYRQLSMTAEKSSSDLSEITQWKMIDVCNLAHLCKATAAAAATARCNCCCCRHKRIKCPGTF